MVNPSHLAAIFLILEVPLTLVLTHRPQDECGGHTKEYHFHERLSCLYSSAVGSTHSPQIGVGQDGAGLFGKWEDYSQTLSPKLDVCGGHFGLTPESGSKKVYHHRNPSGNPSPARARALPQP